MDNGLLSDLKNIHKCMLCLFFSIPKNKNEYIINRKIFTLQYKTIQSMYDKHISLLPGSKLKYGIETQDANNNIDNLNKKILDFKNKVKKYYCLKKRRIEIIKNYRRNALR